MSAQDVLQGAEAVTCRPWQRHFLTETGWADLAREAAADGWVLLAHWAESQAAHAMYFDPDASAVRPVSVPVQDNTYPALSPHFPGAPLYERMVHDLWGHAALNAADLRSWVDHGQWPLAPPLAIRPEAPLEAEPPMPAEPASETATLLPLGPFWGDRQEPAAVDLMLEGALIRDADVRLGFTHKGTISLMRGKSPRAAARFAARVSGDATVAHAVAFAEATEAASETTAPPRAIALRVAMLEIERITGHLGNIAETAAMAGTRIVANRTGMLREVLLRASEAAFGHRLMMDCVVPGGLAMDLAPGGGESILRALGEIATQAGWLRQMHENAALLAHLSGVARASSVLAGRLAVGGVAGRAGGRGFDVRQVLAAGYAPFSPRMVTRPEGDAAARQQLRVFEIEESIRLVSQALNALPAGPVSVPPAQVSGEGVGCAESVRGDVWHWLQLDHGQIAAVFMRDPGWALWPLAQAILTGARAEDAALIRLSLALPSSAVDL